MFKNISEKYKEMGQTSRWMLFGGGFVLIVLIVGTIMTDKPKQAKKPVATMATDHPTEVMPEQVAAEQHASSMRIRELEDKVQSLTTKQNVTNPTTPGF